MEDLERARVVAALVDGAKAALAARPLSRDILAVILEKLTAVAALRHLWSDEAYPAPVKSAGSILYMIAEDPSLGFAVYLDVAHPGKRMPPHNHTTWACVAAVEGCEHNYLYERLDDGATPGHARIREIAVVRVESGRGVALMPDDIHAIANEGDTITRQLHFYGRALETLNERLVFNPDTNSSKPMPLTVSTRL